MYYKNIADFEKLVSHKGDHNDELPKPCCVLLSAMLAVLFASIVLG